MYHIRPYKLFIAYDRPTSERIVRAVLPQRRATGGVTLLETFLILASCRIVNARRVFEIGTFLGNTTVNLALNVPDSGRVFTLDLDQRDAAQLQQHAADAPLTQVHLSHKTALDFVDTPAAPKIEVLVGNSTTFDYSRWERSIDAVYIDGGHDEYTVKSDTENALQLVRKEEPSCILWHDYGNRDYEGLTSHLDELSGTMSIFHIEDTMLCVWFNDPGGTILPLLTG